jgi:large subunit ribosomal protein L5
MRQRLRCFYRDKVLPQLLRKFKYQNSHQVPRLKKIVVSRGLGTVFHDASRLEASSRELANITAQYRVASRARTAISRFKIRKGLQIGIKVTLRGERMYAFFDRLVNLALPRMRDFQGVARKGFDGTGNYNLGLREQLIFPEVQYDSPSPTLGINISVVTSTDRDSVRSVLLRELGIPFERE